MDQNRIDRLFREKLDQLEVQPSVESWSAVEKQTQSKKKGVAWYWVAASLALLFTFWMVWPDNQNMKGTPALSSVDRPVPELEPELILPEVKQMEPPATQKNAKKVDVAPNRQNRQLATTNNVRKDAVDNSSQDIQHDAVDLQSAVATLEVETPELQILEEVEQPVNDAFEYQPVKITYIASSGEKTAAPTDKFESDSTGVLKKFIAFTEKIDPGEMLADIKTAKDNLLSSGFKSKKDRNSL